MRARMVLVVLGCAVLGPLLFAAPALAAQKLDLTNADSKKTFTVPVGTIIDVTLQNPGGSAPFLSTTGALQETSVSGTGTPYVATFRAIRPGTNTIVATAPCSGTGCAAALAFVVTIRVVPATPPPTPAVGVGVPLSLVALLLATGGIVTAMASWRPPHHSWRARRPRSSRVRP